MSNMTKTSQPLTREESAPMLMPASHTPGPWMVWNSLRDNSVNVAAVKDRAFVCEVGKIADGDSDAGVIKSDAALIAAAPDLLEACRTALIYPGGLVPQPVLDMMAEAIKKAGK
jgi:hypothetical protein